MNDRQLQIEEISLVGAAAPSSPAAPVHPPVTPRALRLGLARAAEYLVRGDPGGAEVAFWPAHRTLPHITDLPC